MALNFSTRQELVWCVILSLIFALSGPAAAGEPEKVDPDFLYGGSKGQTSSLEETRFVVRSMGKEYQTIYEQQISGGVPIDLYYYKIPPHKGVPAAQDGQDLWGRFVRVPSANDVDQSSVVWWHVWWSYEDGRWLYHEAENIPPPEVLRSKGGTVRREVPKDRERDVRENERRGKLGVNIQDLTPELMKELHLKEEAGALVVKVEQGSPAERAGIRLNDVIVSYDGTSVMNARHLAEMTGKTPEGKSVQAKIVRDGKERTLTVTIGPPGSTAEFPEKEIKKPAKKDVPKKILPEKETKKPDVPKEKKQPPGAPPKDLGEL